MYLEDSEELHEYWVRNPPLRDIVAAFVGVKPGEVAREALPAPEEPPEFEE